jgi:hypothetical protein
MVKSKERRHGFAAESTILNHTVTITVTDRSVRIGGKKIGHPHGYRKNGEVRISLECVEVADLSVLVVLLDLVVMVAAFSDAAT